MQPDPDDFGPPADEAGGSQVRPSLIVDATAPAALLTVAAEAISFVRLRKGWRVADIGSRRPEIRDAMLRRPVPRVASGCTECGKREQGNCQSKNEGHWVLDRSAHSNLLSS